MKNKVFVKINRYDLSELRENIQPERLLEFIESILNYAELGKEPNLTQPSEKRLFRKWTKFYKKFRPTKITPQTITSELAKRMYTPATLEVVKPENMGMTKFADIEDELADLAKDLNEEKEKINIGITTTTEILDHILDTASLLLERCVDVDNDTLKEYRKNLICHHNDCAKVIEEYQEPLPWV